jgi:iron complex outermembrane recepter protein
MSTIMPTISRPKFLTIAALAASVALGALSAPAFAQTAPATDEKADGEIVVTAQFREQKLQDTPIAITAINSELLASRNQTDISQIAAQAPNVSLTPLGGAFGPSISVFIRGIGQNDFNPAYEPGVGMYVDDVYYPTLTGAVFDLLDLERVEVLRGPQGTLTGRNSIGGAIKLISKKPTGDGGGFVEATYGSRNRTDLRASADFKIAEGLNGRISGVFKRQEGYVDQIDYGCARPGNAQGILPSHPLGNCLVDKLGGKNYSGLRLALNYSGTDKVDWTVIGDYSYENRTNSGDVVTVTTPAFASYICGPRCTYANFFAPAGNQLLAPQTMPNHTTFKGWGVSSNFKYELTDDLNIQSITAHRRYTSTWGTDDDFTPDLFEIGQGFNRLKHTFLSQELRLNGKAGESIEWTLGGYYSKQTTTYYTQQDIRYIFGPVPALFFQFVGNDPVRAKSKAAFGTVIFHPSDSATLTAGLRYTDESKDYTFRRRAYDGSVLNTFPIPPFRLAPLDGLTASYKGNKLDWRISADYRFSPAALAYATVSTGFKGGGVSARPFTARQAQQGTFGPETVLNYELGLKTDLFDRAVRFNVAAFLSKYKKIQLPFADCTAFGGGPCGVRANAGDATFKGIELELSAHPVGGLDVDASLSYLDTKWKAGSIAAAVGTSINQNDPVAGPKWKWSIGIQYEADLGTSGSLTPRFDLSHNGSRFGGRSLGTPFIFDAYTLGNARLTWKNADKDLSVSLEAQNLFNKYYYNSRFDAVFAFSNTVYNNVGRPREYGVSVRKSF